MRSRRVQRPHSGIAGISVLTHLLLSPRYPPRAASKGFLRMRSAVWAAARQPWASCAAPPVAMIRWFTFVAARTLLRHSQVRAEADASGWRGFPGPCAEYFVQIGCTGRRPVKHLQFDALQMARHQSRSFLRIAGVECGKNRFMVFK
jgi:hypothetical protein